MVDKLKTFIKDNNLTFEEGSRNSNIVVLCGYACHIGADKFDCVEALDKKDKVLAATMEIERVHDYATIHNYKAFWRTEAAKEQYKF